MYFIPDVLIDYDVVELMEQYGIVVDSVQLQEDCIVVVAVDQSSGVHMEVHCNIDVIHYCVDLLLKKNCNIVVLVDDVQMMLMIADVQGEVHCKVFAEIH